MESSAGPLSRGSISTDASLCEDRGPLTGPKSTWGLDLSLGERSRPGQDHAPWDPGSGRAGCWDALNLGKWQSGAVEGVT